MLHYFSGKLADYWDFKILKNEFFWINLSYFGLKNEGNFFLYPILDSNHNTLYYLGFDDFQQLSLFYKFIKISGVGPKISCFIVTSNPINEIKKSIENNDVDFFKGISWIGPKTAKKIIIELKDKIDLDDFNDVDSQSKKKDMILKWIVSLWYNKESVKNILKDYDWDLSNMQKVIKDIIKKI